MFLSSTIVGRRRRKKKEKEKPTHTTQTFSNTSHPFLLIKPMPTIQTLRKTCQVPRFKTKQNLKAYEQKQILFGVTGTMTSFLAFVL